MQVTSLSLSCFRNYEKAVIEPDAGVTVFTGPNAQGKTNILEALHLCCLGKSHRTSRDEELIQWGKDTARVTVKTAQRDGTHEVAVILSRTQKKKKTVRIGLRQAERIGELLGHVCGVLFSPEDLQIVKEGPAERRRFMDMQLSQLRPAYFYALQRAVRIAQPAQCAAQGDCQKPVAAADAGYVGRAACARGRGHLRKPPGSRR
ncbi:MAG: DNA replication/repair protein RecF [Christensenellales bacterium]